MKTKTTVTATVAKSECPATNAVTKLNMREYAELAHTYTTLFM